MDEELKIRKEKVVKFITNNRNILIYLVLFLIIALGAFIRVQPFDKLIDSTTGKYISIELDSTVFLRYAETIAENDILYNIDKMRNYPVGVFIKDMGIFTSYFVAYTYRLFNLFIPNITVQYVDILYPVLATIIMTLYLFLFVRRVFNYKVALLCCLFINLIPSFLFRSLGGSSDHDILVMMFMIMSFYFYTVALQSKKLRNNILFGAIAGFTTFLSMYSGGAAQFVLLVVGVATMLEILFNKLEDSHFYAYVSWLVIFSVFIQIIGLKAGILGHLNTLSTMPAYLAFGVALCHFFIIKRNLFNINGYIKDRIPRGVTSVLLTFVFGSALFLILFGFNFFIDKFNQVISYVFHFYTSSRWALTVAENRTPYVVDWIGQFGLLYFLFMLFGIVALFYNSTKSLKIRNKLSILFGIFIFVYVFSRYSPNSVFNGGSTLSRITFYGSIILFFLLVVYLYLKGFYMKLEDYHNISKISHTHILVFIWFLSLVFAATGAMRLIFEFSLVTAVLSAYFVFFVFDYIMTKNNVVKYLGIVLLILVLFSPFSFAKGIVVKHYDQTYTQAIYSGPGYTQQWQIAGKWVRDNTKSDSVFAHWWDYGYWVQSGFERPTITDGGNAIGWWNYLMARDVLTAQNFTEPLNYLYTHSADYLLAVSDDIGKYPAYSSIGSDKRGDRYSYLTNFNLDNGAVQETREGVVFLYRGGFYLDENFVYNEKVYPAGKAVIGGIILPFKNLQSNGTVDPSLGKEVQQPVAILLYNGQQINLPMRCIYIDKLYEFENYSYGGCLRILPTIQNNQINWMGSSILVSRKVVDSLFARLYLFNQKNPYFEVVYDDSNTIPLSVYAGRIIGPIKIWKINYPDNIKLTDSELNYYLTKNYPDLSLNQPFTI